MGIFKQGPFGPFLGKVGNLVGSTWRGINYLRIMPASVHNPNTPAQVTQRTKFGLVVQFLRPLLGFIKMGYKGYAVDMSAYNAAISYQIKHAVLGDYPDQEISFDAVMVSRGNLRGVPEATAAAAGSSVVEVTFEDNSDLGDASADDKAIVVVYNPDKADVAWTLDAGTRSDALAEITLPASYVGDTVHVYLAFGSIADLVYSGTKDTISDSVYAGEVVVS